MVYIKTYTMNVNSVAISIDENTAETPIEITINPEEVL